MSTSTSDHYSQEQLALAIDAYVWGFSRMLYAKYLRDLRKVGAPMNRFMAMDRMASPNEGGINVDTLYGVAWLDLAKEPVVIEVPDSNDRYYSIMLIDVHAYNFDYIGRRVTGTKAGRFLMAGPEWQGETPAGMTLIRCPSRGVFCFLRTLIDNEADVAIANEFDRGIAISPLSAYPQGLQQSLLYGDLNPYFPRAHSYLDRLGDRFFDCLGDALAEDPPTRPLDIAAMQRFAALGIGPGRHPREEAPDRAALFAEAVKQGHEKVFAANISTTDGGWSATNLTVDSGNNDPMVRASINRLGIGTLSPEEAIYLLPTSTLLKPGDPVPAWLSFGPDGTPLDGSKRYVLHFAPGKLPPVDAFWSITMYDGVKFLLVANPINRYAIGDRTPGLVFGADGSLDLYIQHECPSQGPANWLPAPEGSFHMIFRAYQPREEFTSRNYWLPPLRIVG